MTVILVGLSAVALVGVAVVEVGMPAVDRWRRLRALGGLSRLAQATLHAMQLNFGEEAFAAEAQDLALLDAQLAEAWRLAAYDYPGLARMYGQFTSRVRGAAAARAIAGRLGYGTIEDRMRRRK